MTRTGRMVTIAVLGTIGSLAGVTTAVAGGGGHCEPMEGVGETVEMAGACFTPSTLRAEPGQTITFVNRDPFAHNVSGTGWGHHDDMAQGDRFTASFADGGIYPFACTLHPGMNGVIVVGDTAGASPATADTQPMTASATPPTGEDRWILAGAAGLLIGSAAGTVLADARRRRRPSEAENEGGTPT